MPRKLKYQNRVDRTLVELWVDDKKLLSVSVKENSIMDKIADFKNTAFREGHLNWAVYVIRPCVKYGSGGYHRKLSKEMQIKWNESMKKTYKQT